LNIFVSTVVGDGRLNFTASRIAGFSAQWKYPLAPKFIAVSYPMRERLCGISESLGVPVKVTTPF
jgi:hypothetical protein